MLHIGMLSMPYGDSLAVVMYNISHLVNTSHTKHPQDFIIRSLQIFMLYKINFHECCSSTPFY